MPYITCPTCGNLLGDRMLLYKKEMLKIDNNDKLTLKQRIKEREKLPKKFGLTRYCCIMRVISSIDYADIIVSDMK